MMSLLRLRVWLLALILLVVLGPPVLAQGGDGGEVLFGQDFTLHEGQRLHGDVVVFGGDAFVEEGGVLQGELMTIGGAIHIAGHVDGNVFALGGDVSLSETAVVSGDVTASGDVVREPGAVVTGQVLNSFRRGIRVPSIRPWPGPSLCLPTWGADLGDLLVSIIQGIFGALVVVALGVLVVLLIPGPTHAVGESLLGHPAQSIGAGLLTGLVAVLAVPLLVITCLGIPVAVALALAVAIATLFGWIAAGLVLGERLLDSLNRAERQPLPAVALGLVILAVLSGVPCLGFLVSLLVGTWGLGAVVLTRFGTAPYVPSPPRVTSSPLAPRPELATPPEPPEPSGAPEAPERPEDGAQAGGSTTAEDDGPPPDDPGSSS